MKIVLDFVIGKVDVEEFKEAWYSNPEIGIWLDGLVDVKTELKPEWKDLPDIYYIHLREIHYRHDGSVLKYLQFSDTHRKKLIERGAVYPKWVTFGWHFDVIAAIIKIAYPDIVPTPYYDQERDFLMAVVGDYIGGSEIEQYLNDLLDNFPTSMPKSKRKKEAKAAIREAFHLDSNKYPNWIHEPEWPMGLYSPMVYVSRKRDGDLVLFTFKDFNTGEIKVVEQFY